MYFKDLTGQRFGRLIVIERRGSDKHHNALWLCKCDCGEECIVNGKALRHGDTRSCGCLHSEDLVGKRFGRLLVIEELPERGTDRRIIYRCLCDCGNVTNVTAADLRSGHTRSCGCLMRETSKATLTTHGESKTRLYTVWSGMKGRCNRPSSKSYKNYGGRGIKVCPEWEESFEAFATWAYENGYDETAKRGDCTIDRVDVNGDYEPSNCRWVDMKIQARNTRRALKGEKK